MLQGISFLKPRSVWTYSHSPIGEHLADHALVRPAPCLSDVLSSPQDQSSEVPSSQGPFRKSCSPHHVPAHANPLLVPGDSAEGHPPHLDCADGGGHPYQSRRGPLSPPVLRGVHATCRSWCHGQEGDDGRRSVKTTRTAKTTVRTKARQQPPGLMGCHRSHGWQLDRHQLMDGVLEGSVGSERH